MTDDPRPKVAVGYVHDHTGPSHSWYVSMWSMKRYDAEHGRLIRCELAEQMSKVTGLGAARNEVAKAFLATDCQWLLMVDRDMGWPEDALYRLLSAADPAERPIVGGLCFAAWATHGDGMGGWRFDPTPTIYLRTPEGLGNLGLYPVDTVVRADATGAAFLLVHRRVFEALGKDWFSPFMKDGEMEMGEDFSFCTRAREAGFPLWVHTGVKTSHHKDIWLSEEDYWRSYEPPPATEYVEIVGDVDWVSLRASTGLACNDWHDHTAPWLLLADDGATFKPGWLDHAQHVGNSYKASVVQAGVGLLVRREFADEVGDDPAKLIEVARERGVFQVAAGARVEAARG